jgi:GrpB-like predicted nucleotidyltransferase (UPF0157 family)
LAALDGEVYIGPMATDPIEVVAYDERWGEIFTVAERELRDALALFALDVEHIGSTAVPVWQPNR